MTRATKVLAVGSCAVAMVIALTGCGSSSQSTTPTSSTTTATTSSASPSATIDTGPAGGLSVAAVEHALLRHGGPPAPTQATCHFATTAERAASPFGHTTLPILICTLTLRGQRASYAVQVQRNNCFVAERKGGGQAVYGCGIVRS